MHCSLSLLTLVQMDSNRGASFHTGGGFVHEPSTDSQQVPAGTSLPSADGSCGVSGPRAQKPSPV